jgi:hypothetical protein
MRPRCIGGGNITTDFGAQCRSVRVCGRLQPTGNHAGIGERIDYFPRLAKNIEYWCRPYWSGINGSFDIGEQEYLDWTYTMGWKPRELGPAELGPSILVMHNDGSEEYIERSKLCYVYKYQTFKKPGQLSRDFQILYDRTRKYAYFADSDGRAGPPSGDLK